MITCSLSFDTVHSIYENLRWHLRPLRDMTPQALLSPSILFVSTSRRVAPELVAVAQHFKGCATKSKAQTTGKFDQNQGRLYCRIEWL